MMKLRMPLLAAALVLVLAGCAALPTSGAVQTGKAIDTQTQVRGVYQPSGPQPGSKPEVIVTDFIQAALDPQNDYATARKFLSGVEQQKWNPNANVSIQQGVGTSKLDNPTHVTYAASVIATVNGTGVYTEQAATPITPGFDLRQVSVGGSKEWRIVGLDDGVIISQSTFDAVYAAYPLYFFAPGYKYLVPDVRWFATTDTITTRIANALLVGPTSWLASPVLITAFPPGTTLDSGGVSVDSAIATVDLTSAAKQNTTATDRARMQQQLSASLTSVSNVRSVALSIGGVVVGTSSNSDSPIVQPQVTAAILAQQKDAFGFVSGDTVMPVAGISTKTKSLGLTGATYSDASSALAYRTPAGIFYVKPDTDPVQVAPKAAGLVDPSLDPTGFTWYLQSNRLSTLSVYLGGTSSSVDASSLAGDARVVSMDVSRDGARLLLYLDSAANGPQLVVVGIIRDQNNVPTKLGTDAVYFPVSAAQPIDATWESDRAVAAISGTGANATIREYAISGPSVPLGSVSDATQIVGGNGGAAGLRVLDKKGIVYRASGTGTSWGAAGYSASFIATQQPG